MNERTGRRGVATARRTLAARALLAMAAATWLASAATGCSRGPRILVEVEGPGLAGVGVTALRLDVSGSPLDTVSVTLPAEDAFADGHTSVLYRPNGPAGTPLDFVVTVLDGADVLGTGSALDVPVPDRGASSVTITLGGVGFDSGTDSGLGDSGPATDADAGGGGPCGDPVADDHCEGSVLMDCLPAGTFAASPCAEICAEGPARCTVIVPSVDSVAVATGVRDALEGPVMLGEREDFAVDLGDGDIEFNTDSGEILFYGEGGSTATLRSNVTGWSNGIYYELVDQSARLSGAPDVGAFVMRSFVVGAGVAIRATGSAALAILVPEEIRIAGPIQLSAGGTVGTSAGSGGFDGGGVASDGSGPGAIACFGTEGSGTDHTGGGGGAFGGAGGSGGEGGSGGPVGLGGAATDDLSAGVLYGGCGGGSSQNGGDGGGGGGALYLFGAAGVYLEGTATFDGGGNGGASGGGNQGGGGGGAGGRLLLEGAVVVVAGGVVVAANGGGGGAGDGGGNGAAGQIAAAPASGGSGGSAGGTGGALAGPDG
ncbi:MAG TPA: hypothetical protein VG389_04605, partial [Myxococcota bacterium]|nr:hypothetical protein [Myxococcota bacterium]